MGAIAVSRAPRDKQMHYGTANMLGGTFTPEQRQVLAYLFWEIFGAEASHNRRNRAEGRVTRDSLKPGGGWMGPVDIGTHEERDRRDSRLRKAERTGASCLGSM